METLCSDLLLSVAHIYLVRTVRRALHFDLQEL
jgi:hypothetical protein